MNQTNNYPQEIRSYLASSKDDETAVKSFLKGAPKEARGTKVVSRTRFEESSRKSTSRPRLDFNPLGGSEMEVRAWLGLHERGMSADRLEKLKKRVIIGAIAVLAFVGILITHPIDSVKSPAVSTEVTQTFSQGISIGSSSAGNPDIEN
ncbi:MAG: hypothetical protein K2X27_09605 [Candidatus Obscuribacterales bacterium]|nr:hypothetical protein [Candidatus Obscuribacterales bacterium]